MEERLFTYLHIQVANSFKCGSSECHSTFKGAEASTEIVGGLLNYGDIFKKYIQGGW